MKRIALFALLTLAVSLAIFAASQRNYFAARWLKGAASAQPGPTPAPAAGQQPTRTGAARPARNARRTLDNFDIRADLERNLAAPPENLRAVRKQQLRALGVSAEATESSALEEHPRARLRWSSLTGTPSRVVNLERPLAEGRGADAEEAARDFLRERREMFRLRHDEVKDLRLARRFESKHNGLTHLTLEQRVSGVEVFQGRLNVHLDRDGAVRAASGELIPDAARHVNLAEPRLASADALRLAAVYAESELKASAAARAEENSSERRQTFDQSIGFARDVEARLVYFPLAATSLRLAWEFTLWLKDSPDVYLIVVDAERGSLLYRFNYTTYEDNPLAPHGLVFTGDSPRPALPYAGNDNPPTAEREDAPFRAAPFNGATIFSPSDRHYDWWAGQLANNLISNNVDAHLDRSPADNIADEPRLVAADGNFSFPLDLTLAPTDANNQKAAQVNLFYWVNRYHDILYSLGFTEAAGNFQADNFGLGGLGGDAIQADVQDASGTNNANFSTPPDGRAGRVQMFLWSGAPMIDGDFDQGIIIHELTHGLTNRLVGNGAGLVGLHAQGMGEGWSDYFGLALLRKESDDVDGVYPVGQYVRSNYARGIRRYPYSTDLNVNPLTFGDIALNTEVHRVGEIWCGVLWEVRAALIKKYGFREGQRQSLQLVVDGLKLTPNSPTFIDARDAILLADRVNNGGANQCLLWQAFSKRGLGYSAGAAGVDDPAPTEAFDPPPFCNDAGSVRLDKNSYLIGEAARVSVGDRNASGPVRVEIVSTATGDRETLALAPDAVYAGAYNGSIRLTPPGGRSGDGAVQASIEAGDQIKVTYLDGNVGSGQSATATATAGVVREKTIFEDTVESGNRGWITAGGWAITPSRAASPSRSWTDSPSAGYANNSTASLTSAAFDCTGLSDVSLSFAHSHDFESGFDFGLVEFSIDDGATWTRAASFTGQRASFGQVTLALGALDNQPRARLRFRLQSDTTVTADGWYVDDIRLTGRSSNPAVVKPGDAGAPAITSITPAFGPPAGGTPVQIVGQNFTDSGDTAVTFDGVAARSVNVVSSSVISVTTPPQPEGRAKVVTVRVANRYGEVALAQGFTYYNNGAAANAPTLTGVFPNSGSTRGGAAATLVGTNFTPATTVSFGPLAAAVTYVNPTTLRALSPAATASGAVAVSVNNTGQSATLNNAFTYYAPTPPGVRLLSPQGGETLFINQTVTIRWNSSDNRALSRHRVALYRNAGGTLTQVAEIAGELSGEAQSLNWTVPASIGAMTNARVRVLAIDDEGAEAEAFSSGDFTIARRWEAQGALPAALQRLAVVSDGNSLYALGGRTGTASTTTVETVSRFNPASNSWTSEGLAKMPAGLSAFDAAYLNGKIYVPGGMVSGSVAATHYAYDIAGNSWATLAEAPASGYWYALAADAPRGVYYLTGGVGSSGTATTAARVFNPQTNTWDALAPMKTARYGHRAAVIDGKLYVVGGYGTGGGLAGGEVYDFASRQWTTIANLNRPRAFAASAVVQDASGNPFWLVVGGEDPVTRAVLQSAEVYDAKSSRWIALDNSFNLTAARTHLAGAVLSGQFYAVGGGTNSTTTPLSSAAVERMRISPFAATSDGQPPALAVPAAQIAIAGHELRFDVTANALRAASAIIISADGLPANATLTTSQTGQTGARATLRWTPADADTGRTLTVNFTATDGQFSETKAVTIRVVTASPLAVVNAASYKLGALPADSIATAFGTGLAVRIEHAQALPLPTEMAGTTVMVNGVAAPLLYVSPTQINFVIPPTAGAGRATIIVSNPAGNFALAASEVTPAAPAIFSADSTGAGDAAAVATADGVSYEFAPFNVSVNGRQNILLLFGTGFRHAEALNPGDENGVAEAVRVTVEGREARVLYAGAQGQFVGLDQLNVELPPSLEAGARRAEVKVYLNGVEANRVSVQLK
jgi:uncharacterized protein (TIGR03437 family)